MFADFRHPFGKLRRQPLSEIGKEESIAAKRKVEYNKIRPNMLEKDHIAGLPRLAAYQDSNPSFCMFRRFGPVAARILLVKEIELEKLVTNLNQLDEADSKDPEKRYRLRSTDFYEGCDPKQRKLMKEIEIKFKDYYDFLLKYVDVRDLSTVNARHHRSVHTWMIDNRPLFEDEEAFIYSVDDFIMARRSSSQGSLHGSKIAEQLEDWIAKQPRSGFRSWLHGWVKGGRERSRTSNPYVHHYSSSRLGIVAKVVASAVAFGVLLIPVFILYLTNLSREKMAVIVGSFVLMFMVSISVLADVTAHDLFIGIAAYSAVLVALLSNLAQAAGPSSSSPWNNVTAGH